jgi:hypothetical protein
LGSKRNPARFYAIHPPVALADIPSRIRRYACSRNQAIEIKYANVVPPIPEAQAATASPAGPRLLENAAGSWR